MAFIKLNFNVDVNKSLSGLKPTLRLGRSKSGIKKLKKEMARLRAKRDDIKNQIHEAESKGKIPTNEVSLWLQEVEILEGKVADHNFQNMSCFSCNCFNQTGSSSSQTQQAGDKVLSNRLSINLRVMKNLGEANELMSRAGSLVPIATDLSRLEPGIEKLKNEMARLRAKRDDINNKIDQAEREGRIQTNEVSQWLLEVETLEGQVTDIQSIRYFSCNNCSNQIGGTLSQTQQEGDQAPFGESSNCCSIKQRAAEKLLEANGLMRRASALDPIATVRPPITVMPSSSHRPHVGMESYVEGIVGYIDGGEGNIIGIFGMGGVGKTTVLESIKQYYLHDKTIFYHVIWVVASKDCQLKRLQMDIAKSLRLKTLEEGDDERTCGDKLFSYLKDKNYLLLLDDIWERLDLKLLGMTNSATEQGQQQQQQPHHVVVFTTRKELVCVQMKARKVKVKCLDRVEAWQLFQENSDGDVLDDNGINSCAQKLAEECAGLPLALITVARAMSGKKSWVVWNHAVHQIREKHERITINLSENLEDVVYKAFKLSYNSLEKDSIKECLLCCALWPKDYEIHKFEELIPCCIGCGIIPKFDEINEAFSQVYSHLDDLVTASLLEDSSRRQNYYEAEHVKMHNIYRDMALKMVSGLMENGREWIVKAGIGLHNVPRQEEWQKAKQASFMRNQIRYLQDYGVSAFPKLSMLILHDNNSLTIIPPSLFASMPHLKYLDLSKCRIIELPMEISSLTELQYLNLAETGIIRLPIKFGCLSKLEYLILRGTKLKIVPNGTISKLSMLRWLDIREIYSESEWRWDELIDFKGNNQISLGIAINPVELERFNELPNNISVWNLTVRGSESSKFPKCDVGTLQWSPRVRDNLECLEISDVSGDILMMNADVDCKFKFRCLKTLNFRRLRQLEKILLNGVEFKILRDLYIYDCPKLKDVSWVLQLPVLNLLNISKCCQMEELISNVGNSNSRFNIKMLILDEMENLHRIASQPLHFFYLKYIDVVSCPSFQKLPFGAGILKRNLKKITGDQTWWDNLDWDDASDKESLAPYFSVRQQFP